MSQSIYQLQTISAIICIIIIALTLLTSIKILTNYRKKSVFLFFIVGHTCAIIPQFLLFIQSIELLQPSTTLTISSTTISLFSFMIVNFMVMKMFAPHIDVKKSATILIGCGLILAIVLSAYLGPYELEHSTGYPILDISMLIIVMLMFVITRLLPLPTSYFISLVMMFAYQLCVILNHYVFDYREIGLVVCMLIFAIIYYVIIYYIQLHWILNRLIYTYQASIIDGLTGLYVRGYFERKVLQMMPRKHIAIIFCDIDNFKQLNDTKGHHMADLTLQLVATIMKEEVSAYGLAGRYGGEELVAAIVIDKVKPNVIAERIRSRIENESGVTISIGVSTTKDANDLRLLFKQADEAMYYSKHMGKNKVTLFRSLPATLKEKITL